MLALLSQNFFREMLLCDISRKFFVTKFLVNMWYPSVIIYIHNFTNVEHFDQR